MSTSFKIVNVDDAIKKLQDLKRVNNNSTILICTIDFDNDEERQMTATPEEGCILVKKSKTVILNEDEFIPHIELYSIEQKDISNIIRRGTMHDIIFGYSG